jgi:hypothetical protein
MTQEAAQETRAGSRLGEYIMTTFYVAAGSSNATEIGTCSACVVGHHNCRAQITDLIGPRCGHQSLGEGDHLWWRGRAPTTDGQQCRHVVPATQEIRTHHWAAVTQKEHGVGWGGYVASWQPEHAACARFNSGAGKIPSKTLESILPERGSPLYGNTTSAHFSAPPPPPPYFGNSGDRSRSMDMEGTPLKMVMRSAWISSRASCTSHLYLGECGVARGVGGGMGNGAGSLRVYGEPRRRRSRRGPRNPA